MKANLPAMIRVNDYHDFPFILDIIREILPKVKIKEVGFDGSYIGMVYTGSLKDKQNKSFLAKISLVTDSGDR